LRLRPHYKAARAGGVMHKRLSTMDAGKFQEGKLNFALTVAPLLTKDGLLPCEHIHIDNQLGRNKIFLRETMTPLFPLPSNIVAFNYLCSNLSLWSKASLKVSSSFSISGSAPIFSVPFDKAVKIALQEGAFKSKYYYPERVENGRHETLLIHLSRSSEIEGRKLQLQAWQYTPGKSKVYYLHALSDDFQSYISHLDGAMINFSQEELDVFIGGADKVKGSNYEKLFRLDGEIEIKHMHGLAKSFFATEELYNEAFEVIVI
jgi:hypothetical protein